MCTERYDGENPYSEADHLRQLAERILRVQKWLQERNRLGHPLRAFHAKIRLGVENAVLRFNGDLPANLTVGFARPGAEYRGVIVRLSNASGSIQPDAKRDMRGIAIRVKVSSGEFHDFLMTNGPVSHAKNGTEFIAFAEALAGSRLKLPFRLLFNLGPYTAIRMFRNVLRYACARIESLAEETYWSRGPLKWGPDRCGRVRFVPATSTKPNQPPSKDHIDYLRLDIADRLRGGPVEFDLLFQPFFDKEKTPIEDASKLWRDDVSAPIKIGRLIIPQQDLDVAEARAVEERVDRMVFNPWHTTDDFRPLGHINRARKVVYAASASYRLGYRFLTEEPVHNRVFGPLFRAGFRLLNVFVPWHRLGPKLGSMNLLGLRYVLRRENLIDTEEREAPPVVVPVPVQIPEEVLAGRTEDGRFNDLSVPRMGAEPNPRVGEPSPDPDHPPGPGATFGRNAPLDLVRAARRRVGAVAQPNPVEVSERLLARRHFIPAKSLNLLAAAWIQFQVHDWVDHPKTPVANGGSVEVPMPGGTTWQNTLGGPPEDRMRIAPNVPRVTRDPRLAGVPVFENQNNAWWDAGQLYGYSAVDGLRLREPDNRGGLRAELRLVDGLLPASTIFQDPATGQALEDTGFNENWWLGLSIMHTLFAREHNVVVGELRRAHPGWREDHLFRTARLVIAALIAKIHTIEWTPAILATPTIDMSLNGNWSGAPKDWLSQLGVWLVDAHALKGITETLPDHHAAPYSLTEEFVTVYRLHPLIPDDYLLTDFRTGRPQAIDLLTPDGGRVKTATADFWQLQGFNTRSAMKQIGLANAVYSFATAHPGAITLHNYPNHLRRLVRRNGERIDLSVVDLVRERDRGIPRYNEFRRMVHKPRVRSFHEITSVPGWAEEMNAVYGGDVDNIDTMVGLLAENPPTGFGFSDTAFRIFILMASRRLQSDRFLTVDFRPEVYSPLGLDWVRRTGMKDVIERHCPELSAHMPRNASAFAPWRPAGLG
ncbi:peroxidase : Animal heme peroxidase OS=Streptomyces ipomoeae 91-03 GN=STRIP9103_08386 PE=4 SV=1: Catalase: An_peroxidase [Gemmata massiliana]|uniref:Catalase n=1 Tax=Gemmata massiliana TaxID=1210884 RepID=A0A6P2D5Q5_9BACT|nr:peroxidase family protein [Gemmata massiliana]VTR95806.1 peroxidase : Animal heme peroxidase OS=Streptomyces ipomoeae 91-03 GN=STRIP9103_08386 PE=4 SV=1: Catalase: An_peroxidase [Gemmata massiliana]